jgi:CheY-like chemotaxis protein
VVDDEAEIRDTLAELLRGARHRVVTANSGREALQRIAEERYDVIVTDIRMPDVDGFALYQQIHQRWPKLAERVVFVTGDTLTTTLREFANRSGRPVLEKPLMQARSAVSLPTSRPAAKCRRRAWVAPRAAGG